MTNGARNQEVVENRVSIHRFVNFVNQVERRTNIESIKIAANINIRVRNAARINNGSEEGENRITRSSIRRDLRF